MTGTAPGWYWLQPRWHCSSIGAHTDPCRVMATPMLSPVVPRWMLAEYRNIGKPALFRDAIGIHWGSAWALPATTLALP
ncbi:hypothetical protein DPMN_030499 [Dreissena polymorpha]|uniref:Uncharacterized protein n=1 Tax=Dreissena polymorpha TaxID=45954 RepID=A0A9D4RH56_DREPO|nr:hypothetical protein DPMN_030499 [Dreissena polymorpha]